MRASSCSNSASLDAFWGVMRCELKQTTDSAMLYSGSCSVHGCTRVNTASNPGGGKQPGGSASSDNNHVTTTKELKLGKRAAAGVRTAGDFRKATGLTSAMTPEIVARLDERAAAWCYEVAPDNLLLTEVSVYTDGSATTTKTWPVKLVAAEWAMAVFATSQTGQHLHVGASEMRLATCLLAGSRQTDQLDGGSHSHSVDTAHCGTVARECQGYHYIGHRVCHWRCSLMQTLRRMCADATHVTLSHVRAHTGMVDNEYVDSLANKGRGYRKWPAGGAPMFLRKPDRPIEATREGTVSLQLFETLFWGEMASAADKFAPPREDLPGEVVLTIATANVCTFCPARVAGADGERCAPSPHRVAAAIHLHENGLDVVGFRKADPDTRIVVGGLELWVRTTVLSDAPDAFINHADPRRLLLTVRLAGRRYRMRGWEHARTNRRGGQRRRGRRRLKDLACWQSRKASGRPPTGTTAHRQRCSATGSTLPRLIMCLCIVTCLQAWKSILTAYTKLITDSDSRAVRSYRAGPSQTLEALVQDFFCYTRTRLAHQGTASGPSLCQS